MVINQHTWYVYICIYCISKCNRRRSWPLLKTGRDSFSPNFYLMGLAGVGTNQPILDRLLDVFAWEPDVCGTCACKNITSVSYFFCHTDSTWFNFGWAEPMGKCICNEVLRDVSHQNLTVLKRTLVFSTRIGHFFLTTWPCFFDPWLFAFWPFSRGHSALHGYIAPFTGT